MGRIGKFKSRGSQTKGGRRERENEGKTDKKIWKKPWKHILYLNNNRRTVLKSIKNEKWNAKKKMKYVKWKGIRLNLYHYRFNDKLLKLETKGKKEGWKFERPIWGLKEGYRILNIATANVGGARGINEQKTASQTLWKM